MLISWQEFLKGKRKRKDVAEFSVRFMDNIIKLNSDLTNKTYRHGSYYHFKINDPKPRDIHKATIRDRIVHHAIYRSLYPFFDKKFIDHQILKDILSKYIKDTDILWLLGRVIDSFHTENNINVGLPLGNVTSQLLINVYMNEFDQFLKRNLKVKYCIRYADDFLILDANKLYLENLIPKISAYLESELKLSLHPDKVYIKAFSSGVDFLGWVHFPHHRVLRTTSKRRMFRKLKQKNTNEILASYFGMLKHGNTYKLVKRILGEN